MMTRGRNWQKVSTLPRLKAAKEKLEQDSFEAVAREWFVGHSTNWTEGHANRVIFRLENDVFPWLGKVPVSTIEPPDILQCLRRVESRGAVETAHRIKQTVGQVFRYAVATGKAKRDQTADLKGALPPVKQKHFAAIIEPKQIGELLRGCWAYKGMRVSAQRYRPTRNQRLDGSLSPSRYKPKQVSEAALISRLFYD